MRFSEELKPTGLTIKAFAEKVGIKERTLYDWTKTRPETITKLINLVKKDSTQ